MRAVYSIVEIRDALCVRDRKDNAGRMSAAAPTKPRRADDLHGFCCDATCAKIRKYIAGLNSTMTPP
jgi:hypothetical protein